MKIEVYLDRQPWSGSTAIYFVQVLNDGTRRIAKPVDLVFEPIKPDLKQDPTLTIGLLDEANGFCQALAEGLSRAGYRPETSAGGELEAVKRHLEDMRRIATGSDDAFGMFKERIEVRGSK